MTSLRTPLFLACLLAGADALACGGFFCSSEPIDQSKERIVFAIDEEAGTVEAHVQIFYQGAAEDFAWIVPVPTLPDPDISTDRMFERLEAATRPTFALKVETKGDCEYEPWVRPPYSDSGIAFDGAESSDSADSGGVQVIATEQIGAFEMTTLQASSSAALTAWLADPDGDPETDDAFDLPANIGDVLTPYVAEDAFFVALKLQNGRSAGDITPIRFTYEGNAASIPLILTSIAATPDMRLQPYVLANHRAVPDNYLHVNINEAAIDWLGRGANYDQVITQAANEAGGQAFATDYAGPTTELQGTILREGELDTSGLVNLTDPDAFIANLRWGGWPRTAQMMGLFERFIPMPADVIDDGVDPAAFYNCISCYTDPSAIDFDPAALIEALEDEIKAPIEHAEQLLVQHAWLTRLTSSMSPAEMTTDPMFTLNGDMTEVDPRREAALVYDCGEQPDPRQAPRHIRLSDGTVIVVPPESRMYEDYSSTAAFTDELEMMAALTIEDADSSGEPTTLKDNTEARNASLQAHNEAMTARYGGELPEGPGGSVGEPLTPGADVGGCGCNTSPRSAWFLALPTLLVAGRRRR